MIKTEKFKVFGSQNAGRILLPDGLCYDKVSATHISPWHGRAVAIKTDDFDWISVKGGGWNYGGPQVYISNKDEELIFGLYPLLSAQRELEVSREIEKFSNDFPKVLYYKRLSDYELPKKFKILTEVTFRNGVPVNPCLLYTRVKCPYRIADLAFFSDSEKENIVKHCGAFWGGAGRSDFLMNFVAQLAKNVALLHLHGFINDTLDWGNITLLAEVMDYEWVTAPGIRLTDGSDGQELAAERREKEILYGAEACLQMAALLHEECNLFDIYDCFIKVYRGVNPEFVQENVNIRKMLARERIII